MNQTDYGMPVYNLQHMLRTIFQVRGLEPEVIPDGFFNDTTEQAVKVFQSTQNIQPNGVVDNATWDLVVEAYDLALIDGKEPIAVQLFTKEDFEKQSGESAARLKVLQAMLNVMNARFANLPAVEITGKNDAQTVAALDLYRTLFDLPQGEGMDNQLWYHFVKAYESAVLPHDFENLENNKYKPSEARQQIDLRMRNENSMAESLPEEQLRDRQQTASMQPQMTINRMPMLDSYQSLRRTEEEMPPSEMQPEVVAPQQSSMENIQRKNPQNRRPLKWNF